MKISYFHKKIYLKGFKFEIILQRNRSKDRKKEQKNQEEVSVINKKMSELLLPPLSPLSQYINTPILTFYIMGVCELEHSFDKSQTLRFVDDVFIPLNKRFSSIIITDEKGVQRWKKVECLAEDHVKVPTFPSSTEENHLYDEELEEYISDINMKELPQDRPPWEVHLIMYPTKNAAGSLVFKLNHALGDGYSFMGALFSIFKTADNPTHPLKFPSASSRLNADSIVLSKYARVSGILTKCKNTVTDFTQGLLRTYFGDADTVIKSSTEGVEYNPITISSVIISLDHIRDVKSKVGGTVNDVTTGLIAYSLHLYMKKLGETSDGSTTALIVMNMRMLKGYKSLAEMLKASIWGNHFGFLTISLPSFNDFESVDPLDFIVKSKEEMKRKTNSLGIYFTSKLLNVLGMVRGPETAARYLHSNLRNASIMVTNMCGPVEKAAIAGNPLKGLYFTVPGVPQSLVFTIVSYMGKLTLVATAEKGFIDSKLMSSCIKEAFTKIYVAACGESPTME